jgi:hypothetical protein
MTTKTKPKTKPKKNPLSRKKPIGKKIPQLFIDSMGTKKSVHFIIENGIVLDIVKTACPDLKVYIHDYDIETSDDQENIFVDKNQKQFHLIEVE